MANEHPVSRRARVLVLEDDEGQRRAIADLVAGEGYEAVPCATIAQAIAALDDGETAAAVVDERLSGESGVEFLERIRSRRPRLHAIMHSAYGSFASVKESLNLGAFAYVEKAAEPDELVAAVHRAVEQHVAERLARSEHRLASIYEAADDGIWVVDPAAERIVECNPRAAEMLGYAREEMAGLEVARVHPQGMARVRALLARVREAGRGTTGELTCTRRDGTTVPAELSASALEFGGRERIVVVVRDMTERRAAEEAVRRSRERYHDLVQTIDGIVWEADPHTFAFLFVSDSAERLTGYPVAEWLATPTFWADHLYREDRERVIDYCRRETDALRSHEFESRFLHANGDVIWLRDLVSVVVEEGRPVRLRGVMVDVTDQRRAEEALRESERRLRAIFDHSPTTMTLEAVDGGYILVNRSYERYFGERDGAEGGAGELAPGERALLESGRTSEREYAFTVDGRERTLLVTRFPVTDDHGRVTEIGSIGADITDSKHAREALARSEERFQRLYDDAPDIYCTVARDGALTSLNEFGAGYLGYVKNELVGVPVGELVHPEDRWRVRHLVDEMFEAGEGDGELEFRALRRDGSILWVHGRFRLRRDETGGPSEMHVVCRDVTEAHDLSAELSYQATHDPLTGLVNRRELEHRLARVIETAHRQGSEHALCYLDLDQFKVINDTCGHVAGDELLRQLGELLPSQVRKRDTLARLGGDEFGVLMEHCSLMQARRVANALRRAIADFRFMWQGRSFSVGASIGLAPITAASEGVADVLSAADTACYVAKDQGRNRIHVYHDDDVELIRRHGEMEWVSRITSALEEGRFRLFYQPIRRLDAGQESGGWRFEILLRMVDERGDLIPPGAFLPAAERYNIAVRVDRWVVGAALEWLASAPAILERTDLCSINLSGHSLADDEFLKFVIGALDSSRVPPTKICFEITETAAIANLTSANRFITALKGWGCRFALDDFGSGLSSFAYLKHLAVDYLKIDGVFVKDVVSDPIDFAMVRSINEIGRVMGKETIAEFVEDDPIIERLREIGVDYAQGYAIGRPEPISALGAVREAAGARTPAR